jgi:Ca2+-binding EF-hand superfamily protein
LVNADSAGCGGSCVDKSDLTSLKIVLTEGEEEQVVETFKDLDINGDGLIYPGAAYTGLDQLQSNWDTSVSEDDMQKLANWDPNGDNKVSFQEFRQAYIFMELKLRGIDQSLTTGQPLPSLTEEEISTIEEIYASLDTNNDGTLTKTEYQTLLSAVLRTSQRVYNLLQAVTRDIDGNSILDRQEFISAMATIKSKSPDDFDTVLSTIAAAAGDSHTCSSCVNQGRAWQMNQCWPKCQINDVPCHIDFKGCASELRYQQSQKKCPLYRNCLECTRVTADLDCGWLEPIDAKRHQAQPGCQALASMMPMMPSLPLTKNDEQCIIDVDDGPM